MANILLLDESDVAGRAMQGILARGDHACFVATDSAQAWKMLREGVVFDLVFIELTLEGSSGAAFLQRLRENWFWKVLPVVVYTSETGVNQVKRALGLGVQNYLIKPYNDEHIHAEIEKAMRNPWRNLLFEEAKSFCKLLGLTAENLAQMRRDVMVAFDKAAQTFPSWAEKRQNQEVFEQITALATDAESAGIWAGVDFLRHLQEQAAVANWSVFRTCGEFLEFASRLIFCQLNPSYAPDCMHIEGRQNEAKEAMERVRWEGVDVDLNGPVLEAASIKKQIDGLAGCPVADSAAAAFQMVADGRAATMSQVMDLVANDPGLTAQILTAANRLDEEGVNEIDDARAGANLLGEIKLKALARTLPTALERHIDLPPLSGTNFWMYQVAVGRVSQWVCSYLEFGYLASSAGTAGLLQDIGKLILLKLHPFGLQAIVCHARERKMSLPDAERKFLGCTTRDLGVHLADTQRLPAAYADVIRWVETPALATRNMELVAIVSIARHVCLHAHVGCSGDTSIRGSESVAATPAWGALQPSVFPSFDLKRFELQARAFCLSVRSELSGQRGNGWPSPAQRSAELV